MSVEVEVNHRGFNKSVVQFCVWTLLSLELSAGVPYACDVISIGVLLGKAGRCALLFHQKNLMVRLLMPGHDRAQEGECVHCSVG